MAPSCFAAGSESPKRQLLKQVGQFTVNPKVNASPKGSPRGTDFLDRLLSTEEDLGTFQTASPDAGDVGRLSDRDLRDAFLQGRSRLNAASDISMEGYRSSGSQAKSFSNDDSFLRQLHAAYSEAVASGDDEAARAVLDAIRAEGGELPSEIPSSDKQLHKLGAASSPKHAQKLAPHSASSASTAPRRCQPKPQTPPTPDLHCLGPSPDRNQAQGIASSASAAAAPPRKGPKVRRARMQDLIASQLDSGGSAALDTFPVGTAAQSWRRTRIAAKCSEQSQPRACDRDELEVQEEQLQDEENKCTKQLGSLYNHNWPEDFEGATVLQKAEAAKRFRKEKGGLHNISGSDLKIDCDGVFSSSSSRELPPSDVPSCCRMAVVSWASGQSSGYRCLLEVASAFSPSSFGTETLPDDLPGRASWQSVARICGLAGGEELLHREASPSNCPGASSFFASGPRKCLQEALKAVRAEVALSQGSSMTLDELHLGLRSLELRARADGSHTHGTLLGAIVSRELLRIYLGGSGTSDGAVECISPAQELARVIRLGASGIELEAHAETLETLRDVPPSWTACQSALTSMVRTLRAELESLQTYGPYAALGIDCDASDSEIRRAYRDLCLLHHPDKGGDTATFQSLQQAHETIMDDRRKGLRPRKPTPTANPSSSGQPKQQPKQPQQHQQQQQPQQRHQQHTRRQQQEQQHHQQSAPSSTSRARPDVPEPGGRGSSSSDAPAAPEAEAQACAEDLLTEISQLSSQSDEAVLKARTAAEMGSSSLKLVCANAGSKVELDDKIKAGMNTILEALQSVVEATSAVGVCAREVTRKALAVGVLGCNPDQAEEVMEASQHCSEAGESATAASMICKAVFSEVDEAMQTMDRVFAGTGNELCMEAVIAAAHRCNDATQEAAEAVAATSLHIDSAVSAARAAAGFSKSHRTQHGFCHTSERKSGYPSPPQQQHAPEPAEEIPSDSGASKAWGRPPPMSAEKPSRPQHASGDADNVDGQPSSQKTPHAEGPPSSMPHQGDRSRSSHAKSGSGGSRGCAGALVRRRVEFVEDLMRLNTEALQLQRQVQQALLKSPLLLPRIGVRQRHRVFTVLAEVLLEFVQGSSLHSSTGICARLHEMLSGYAESALCDSRLGAIRMAALIDVEMLVVVLKGQFLDMLTAAYPSQKAEIELSIVRVEQNLRDFVAGKCV
eukprot:TRINITY_DN3521_c0_g1_i1.p1 TRINITY_DN3521_c0_g1~~TRINITY_DN3521_c0_g1_i1.p1  ORF type:complete len:1189 (+),score=287.26 TRINITY_DN3521_c0_g1_i1:210-3776(+)